VTPPRSNPTFSIVIPTYNRARFLTKAIDSVLQQSFDDYEIIVVDDGSIDATTEVLHRYNTRITVARQANSGVSAARNRGIELANGRWLAFLDSDDEWEQNYLACQFEQISSNPDVMVFITNAIVVHSGNVTSMHFQSAMLKRFGRAPFIRIRRPFRVVMNHPHWYVQSMVVRHDFLLATRLFDRGLTIAEDLDLIAQLSLMGEFGFNKQALVKIFRRIEPIENLACVQRTLRGSKSFNKVFQRLRGDQRLRLTERFALARVSSANERALGNLLLVQGHARRARARYMRALATYPSPKALIKYVMSFLSSTVALIFVRRRKNVPM